MNITKNTGEREMETIQTVFAEPANDSKDIITIVQLPIMEERFQEISDDIKGRLAFLDGLEVSDETKNEAKKILADFRKEFDAFESRRKQVKDEIMRPYDSINDLYKTYVEQPYKSAFNSLAAKIKDIEDAQKAKLAEEAAKYYAEYRESVGLSFPDFESGKFAINLSSTLKKLKEQIRDYLDGVKKDVESIGALENADDIMIEYKSCLDLPAAIKTVGDRTKAKQRYEEEKAKAAASAEQQAQAVQKVDEAVAKQPEPEIKPAQEIAQPTEKKQDIIKRFVFWADVTEEKFEKLKKFMKDEDIKYGKHTGA